MGDDQKKETMAETICKHRDALAKTVLDAMKDFEDSTGMKVGGFSIVADDGERQIAVSTRLE